MPLVFEHVKLLHLHALRLGEGALLDRGCGGVPIPVPTVRRAAGIDAKSF